MEKFWSDRTEKYLEVEKKTKEEVKAKKEADFFGENVGIARAKLYFIFSLSGLEYIPLDFVKMNGTFGFTEIIISTHIHFVFWLSF